MDRILRFTLRHRRLLVAATTGLAVYFALSALTADASETVAGGRFTVSMTMRSSVGPGDPDTPERPATSDL